MNFSVQDTKQLNERGIPLAEAERQLNLLRFGLADIKLDRPCTTGDGIVQLSTDSFPRLNTAFDEATNSGRILRFVPASGAATRMFKDLYAPHNEFETFRKAVPEEPVSSLNETMVCFYRNLNKFAFYQDLEHAMADEGQNLNSAIQNRQLELILEYLLQPKGLSYSLLPKGLLAFHSTPEGARTPFVEHLAESALLAGENDCAELHFTVSPEHKPLFKAHLSAWNKTLEQTYGCHFKVSFSQQKKSTDTLALDANGLPLRDNEGQLVFRPGGHGALLHNLSELGADIVYIRNIDNVVPDERKNTNLTWSRLLTGFLLETQKEQHTLLKLMHGQPEDPMTRELVLGFLIDRLQLDIDLSLPNKGLTDILNRPIRVCGMVKNSGEPGGGPFWVRNSKEGLTRQIVEIPQIDRSDPLQQEILSQSTHFNPVDMVCGLRDWQGRPYDLSRYINHEAAIITSKGQGGQNIRVLEHPGLWNGSMASWHSLFVEIPAEAFNPVKTVFDLLRPAHQPL